MGEGMKRAFEAARKTRLRTFDVVTSTRTFQVEAEDKSQARRLASRQIQKSEFVIEYKERP